MKVAESYTHSYISKKGYNFLNIIYYAVMAAIIGLIGYFIWISLQPVDAFQSEILHSGNLSMGFVSFNEKTSVIKDVSVLTFNDNPKLAYISYGILYSIASNLFMLIGLRYLLVIFKSFLLTGHPYQKIIQHSIFKIGLLVILYGMFHSAFIPFIFLLLGIAESTISVIDFPTLISGMALICLSHIFAYEIQLQKTSNKTL